MRRGRYLTIGVAVVLALGFSVSLSAQILVEGGGVANIFRNTGAALGNSADTTNGGDMWIQNDLEVGDSLYLSRNVFMEGQSTTGADGDQTINFYDNNSRTRNFFKWDDVSTFPACSGTSASNSAFHWNLVDNSLTSWIFSNGTDIEFKLDDIGDLAIDGTLVQSGSCDLAETFLGADLAAGTVVVMDPAVKEGVVASTAAYQGTIVGVVSSDPGVLLNGPTADYYEVGAEMDAVRAQLALDPENDALAYRKNELEQMRDTWLRGDVPVALVGRVPVKVDGSFGSIRQGDPLTSSANPGHAMAMQEAGPMLGVALEDFTGDTGSILVLLKSGWYTPGGAKLGAQLRDEMSDVRAELAAEIEQLALMNRALKLQLAAQAKERGQNDAVLAELMSRLRNVERAVVTMTADGSVPAAAGTSGH